MTISFESPVLFVKDIGRSREFYEGLLGQEVVMDHGLNLVFRGGLSIWEVKRAHRAIFDSEPEGDVELGTANLEVYFESGDLGSEAERLKRAGVEFIHGIHEEPWAQKTCRFYDPDRHIVELAEPMPAVVRRLARSGLGVKEIVQRTTMPLPFVEEHMPDD